MIEFITIRDLQWDDAAHTRATGVVEVEIGEAVETLPYTFEPREHADVIAQIAAGEHGDVAEFVPMEIAPPIPDPISDRQFFQALAERGLISFEEFNEAVGPGVLPASLDAIIDMLPIDKDPNNRIRVRGILRGATLFERDNELVDLIGWGYGYDADDLDDLWTYAGTLK